MGHKPGKNKGGGNIEKPPFGSKSPCVLAAYYPAGTHEVEEFVTKKKKMQDKIVLVWELDLPNSKGEQFRIFEVQTDSFYLSARLRLRVEALLGRKMTDEEADEFDMDDEEEETEENAEQPDGEERPMKATRTGDSFDSGSSDAANDG